MLADFGSFFHFIPKEKKEATKDGKSSIDDSAFEALERDFQEVS